MQVTTPPSPPRARSQHLPPPGPGHNTSLPPPPRLCAGGRYASYWNAFLCCFFFIRLTEVDSTYKSIADLSFKLRNVREENSRHSQVIPSLDGTSHTSHNLFIFIVMSIQKQSSLKFNLLHMFFYSWRQQWKI